MRRFQSILYVTRGGGDNTDSIKQALSIAQMHGASLHALVVSPALPDRLADYAATLEASLKENASASLQDAHLALQMRSDVVHEEVEVELGEFQVADIVRRVLRDAHDLVMKQPEDGKPASSPDLDTELLRLCPCPVWLCRPIERAREEINVAVAVNPWPVDPPSRELAIQLLHMSRSLADRCSGTLHILSCWDYPFEDSLRHSPWVMTPEEIIDERVSAAEREHGEMLDMLIAEAGISGHTRVHRSRGDPEQALPKLAAEREIDLLVMGTAARRGIRGFVVGNTVESVLRATRCSLITMKPSGFRSPIRAY